MSDLSTFQGIVLISLLLLLSGVGGMGISLVFCRREVRDFDRIVLALTWAPILLAVAALALAEAGLYTRSSLVLVFVCVSALGTAGWFIHDHRFVSKKETDESSGNGLFGIAVLAIVIGAGFLAVPAHRYLLGGWDPGEYVCTASNLARTGSLQIQDPLISTLSPAERRALMHEPEPPRRTLQAGYLIKDEKTGVLMPDYFHLYPAWLSVWVLCFGLGGAWAAHSAIALGALAMVMLAAARLFDRRTALLAGLALALCPLQVYMMRFTTAEMLAQFALFAGFRALARTLEEPGRKGVALTAAVAFGASILAHSTCVIPVAGAGIFLLWRAIVRREPGPWGLVVTIGLAAGGALAWNTVRSDTMMRFLYHFVAGNPEHWAIMAAAVAAAWALAVYGPRFPRVLRWAPGVLITLALAYGLFLRPLQTGDPDAENLLYAGRLAGFAGLGLAGLFFWVRGGPDWTAAQKAFLLAGLLAAAVLLANKMVQPVWLWAGRRWAPMVLPFILLLAAAAVTAGWRIPFGGPRRRLWRALGRGGLVLAAGLWFAQLTTAGAPVYAVREYQDLPPAVAALADGLKAADAVLCNHWEPATPLRYLYGLPAWQLSRLSGAGGGKEAKIGTNLLRRWAAEGKTVYWVGEWFYDPALRLEPAGSWSLASRVLERRRDRLPRGPVTENRRFVAWRVLPAGGVAAAGPSRVDVGASAMGLAGFAEAGREKAADGTLIGFRRVKGTGRIWLPDRPGPWRIRMNGGTARLPVTLEAGGRELARFEAGPAWAEYAFEMPAGLGSNGVVQLTIRSDLVPNKKFGVAVDWLTSGSL